MTPGNNLPGASASVSHIDPASSAALQKQGKVYSSSSMRINAIAIFLTVIAILITFKIISIQNGELAEAIKNNEQPQYNFIEEIKYPERGSIYDRWGHLLAGNKTVYEVGVELIEVKNPKTIADTLSFYLDDIDYEEVLRITSIKYDRERAVYHVIVDSVEQEVIIKLEDLMIKYKNEIDQNDEDAPNLSGLTWRSYLERSYPEHTIAANIIGFYAFHDRYSAQGHYGIEEKFNDRLAGKPKKIVIPNDPNQIEEMPTIPPGESLVLTIDREIQSTVEKILDNAVAYNEAKSGTIIVMDPKTGEILAMASYPRLDLNEYGNLGEVFPSNTPFNKAIGETYEPGSVFKVITMAAALDAGVVTPETVYNDEGGILFGGEVITNWDYSANGEQTMKECLQNSLNTCLSWVARQLKPEKFYFYLEEFGIDRRTNIDLAGEVNWPLSTPGDDKWTEISLATNSFGQGLAVTPIQMITAVSAIANDGKMMAPHIVRASINNGQLYNNTPQIINTPISAETACTLSEMLAAALEDGESRALVPGYRVAGKTGTGSIVDPEEETYHPEKTNASFVGWGPVEDPRFIVYVWLQEPERNDWGSIVAAPVFREVVQRLVIILNIPPDRIRNEIYGR